MLDIGFSELLLIAVAALIFIGPKDLPVVVRHVAKFMRELRMLYLGLKKQMHEVMEEAGLNDLHQDMTTIIDLDGKPQKAYNVDELKYLGRVPPPIGGRLGGGQPQSEASPTVSESSHQSSPPPNLPPIGGGEAPVMLPKKSSDV